MNERTKDLSDEQARELHRLSERFARGLAGSLGPGLRRKFEGAWTATELHAAGHCERPETDLVLMLEVGPIQAPAAIALDGDLAGILLDAFLGSPVGSTLSVKRELTEIEHSILEGAHSFLTTQLESAWKDVRALSFTIRDQRNGLRKSHIKGMSEPIATVTIRLTCGEASGTLTVFYPMTLVALLATSAAAPAPQTKVVVTPEKLLQQLNQATVNVEASLEGSTIRLGDLLELQSGDLLRLETAVGHPLELRINGEARMSAKLAPGGKKRSLKVDRMLGEGEAQPAPADAVE